GPAAAALPLAQPSLSRLIQRLEQQLGARLLDRTPQGSQLTEAGEVFLPQAKALLRSAAQAGPRTPAAAPHRPAARDAPAPRAPGAARPARSPAGRQGAGHPRRHRRRAAAPAARP